MLAGREIIIALNIKTDFVDAIDAGDKTSAIRPVRKSGDPRRGDVLQLYTGMRTERCEKIRYTGPEGTYTFGHPLYPKDLSRPYADPASVIAKGITLRVCLLSGWG